MGLFSALFDLIKSALASLWKIILQVLKKIWPLILVVVAIYFAPVLVSYLTTAGGPTWLVNALTWVETAIRPTIISMMEGLSSWLVTTSSSAWTSFASAELSTQLSILVGAGVLLAPEETVAFLDEVAVVATDVIASAVGAVASSGLGTMLMIGAAAYFLLTGSKENESTIHIQSEPMPLGEDGHVVI
jgi:hypothetical protein